MKNEELVARTGQARDRATNYLIINKYRLHLTMMELDETIVDKVMSMLQETFEAGYVTTTQGSRFKEPQGMSLTPEIKDKIDKYFEDTCPVEISKRFFGLDGDTNVYEITEINEHEGETFGYIITLSTDEHEAIVKYFDKKNRENGFQVFNIDYFNLTEDEFELINKYSGNGYSSRLKQMELSDYFDVDKLEEINFGYKGLGMVEKTE